MCLYACNVDFDNFFWGLVLKGSCYCGIRLDWSNLGRGQMMSFPQNLGICTEIIWLLYRVGRLWCLDIFVYFTLKQLIDFSCIFFVCCCEIWSRIRCSDVGELYW